MNAHTKGAASALIVACSMVLASGMAPPATPAPSPAASSRSMDLRAVDARAVDVHGAPLTSLRAVGGLSGDRYGLGVVPLPPPPADKVGMLGTGMLSNLGGNAEEMVDDGAGNVVACPEVRAIVLGESSEDSFAVVGDRLLHRGQALSLGGSRLVVQDLAAKQVTFVRGNPSAGAGLAPVVRCALTNYR